MNYQKFIQSKTFTPAMSGFDVDSSQLNPSLKDFQLAIVTLALKLGRFAIWADCGLGKSLMQLEWASQVHRYTDAPVLILAPCAVSRQTMREAQKFHIDCDIAVVETDDDVIHGINITNYEKLHKFDCEVFSGVVLDESSILKSQDGKTRNQIIDVFRKTHHKLACSATPSPNDHMELGSHAEFLGYMSREEMLSMFFTHDGGDTSKWRLKGHAQSKFWEWVCTWAVMIRRPSDLGFSDEGYVLPSIQYHAHVTKTDCMTPVDGQLFVMEAKTLSDRRKARKASLEERVKLAADLVNSSNEQWLVWCDLNSESEALAKSIQDAIEVTGSHNSKFKEDAMLGFSNGIHRVLVTKPSIAGFGMNWQQCHNTIFVGLSDSYEAYYQAIRRTWRFGQKNAVNCHVVYDELEGAVIRNIQRKESQMEEMLSAMVHHMQTKTLEMLKPHGKVTTEYNPTKAMKLPTWLIEDAHLKSAA